MILKSVGEVIDALGGRRAFAKNMQATPQAVDNWRRTGIFPANTYVMLQAKLAAAGIVVPNHLWAMKKGKKRK